MPTVSGTTYPEPDYEGPTGPDRIEWWTWPNVPIGVTTYDTKDEDDDAPRVCVAYTDTGEPTGGSYRIFPREDLAEALAWAWEAHLELDTIEAGALVPLYEKSLRVVRVGNSYALGFLSPSEAEFLRGRGDRFTVKVYLE